ncbi:MAG: tryptophan-rich sensory protein [Clostridiales bacterium]|nr:tryptophan-rich sensory protein [Clostridiales bacterium]
MERNQTQKIVISFIVIISVALLGTVFVRLGMDWFNSLDKPEQWVPNIVIPIVWTVIYSAFAVINFLWIKKDGIPISTVYLMIINAVLNVLWCLIFFTLKQLLIGNIAIVLNLIAGFALIVDILKTKKIYGYILSIYPIWLSIATTLNLALWILN